jgi:hypothetical protein
MGETTIGGYEVLGELSDSKRFRAFRASRRAPEGESRGTLYLMTDEVRHPDLFIETVDTIRAAWPFPVEMDRDYVLPKAQLWTGRPWFFVPEMLPVASEGRIEGRAAFASLRAQLRWLEQFHPPGGEPHFAHGDVRKERIALFDAEHPLLIAPGWVAASELARGKSLSHVRGDDVWHLGKLWIQESDHSFVPEGMEPEPDEAARRLPRARLPQRSNEVAAAPAREARRTNGAVGREGPPQRRPAETPAPARGAPKRDATAVTAAPAARTARPVRETPPGREGMAARQSPFHREASPPREPAAREAPPVRDAPPVREVAREAPPLREMPPVREAPPVREVARENREPVFASPQAPPVRSPARTAASGASARMHAANAPTVPITPLRTPAGPPVSAAPGGAAPPLRDATAGARPRPARPTPGQLSSPPAYDAASGPPEPSPSAPPVDLGRPLPAPSPTHATPEPAKLAPVAASYYPPAQASSDLAVPSSQAPTSIVPSPVPVAAPEPKRRGMQVAIVLVLLLLAAVFVVALTMLKR